MGWLPIFLSEHPILIGGVSRNGLPDIPHFNDTFALEAKQMNRGNARVFRLQKYMGMDGDEVAVFEGVLNLKHFIRKFPVVLLHSPLETDRVAGKRRIVMPQARVHMLRIGLANSARHDEPQKIDSRIFSNAF